jgi:hypothetical protein
MSTQFLKRLVAALIGGLIVLISVIWYALLARAPRTSNVTPADADYPILNSHPNHTIEVTLLMPASLNLEFSALYSAALGGDAEATPMACHSVEIPVPVSFQSATVSHPRSLGERRYKALVAVDAFRAGRCHWTLDRVLYGRKGAGTSSQLFHFDEKQPSYAMAGHGMLSTFWCRSVAAKDAINAPEVCVGHRTDPPDDTRSIGNGIWPLHLGSEDTQVQIEIMDQDHLVAPQMLLP